MNFDRIKSTIDIQKMLNAVVVIIGGAVQLACDLAASGVKEIIFIDFDFVDPTNPARQDFDHCQIGHPKGKAAAEKIRRKNPNTKVTWLARDFCSFTRLEMSKLLSRASLIVMATDFFPAQARGNQEAIRHNVPALFIGLYQRSRAGEIIYYVPGITKACYRCICSSRYEAFYKGINNEVKSAGTIADIHLTDSIATQIAIGIITRSSDNRMGKLISQLGNRNLIQVKIDPEYTLGNKDIFAKYLGNSPANFSFTSICLEGGYEEDCPDCSNANRQIEQPKQLRRNHE